MNRQYSSRVLEKLIYCKPPPERTIGTKQIHPKVFCTGATLNGSLFRKIAINGFSDPKNAGMQIFGEIGRQMDGAPVKKTLGAESHVSFQFSSRVFIKNK